MPLRRGAALITYRPRPKVVVKKNLLLDKAEPKEASEETAAAVPEAVDIISFWKPNMTINVVDDYSKFESARHVPPQLKDGAAPTFENQWTN